MMHDEKFPNVRMTVTGEKIAKMAQAKQEKKRAEISKREVSLKKILEGEDISIEMLAKNLDAGLSAYTLSNSSKGKDVTSEIDRIRRLVNEIRFLQGEVSDLSLMANNIDQALKFQVSLEELKELA